MIAVDVGHRHVGAQPQPGVVDRRHQPRERRVAAQRRIDRVERGGVVAVRRRRRHHRRQVQHRHAEVGEVRQRGDHAGEVAAGAVVAVPAGRGRPPVVAAAEAIDEHGVHHRVAPPPRRRRRQLRDRGLEPAPVGPADQRAVVGHEAVAQPPPGAGHRRLEPLVGRGRVGRAHRDRRRAAAVVAAQPEAAAGAVAERRPHDDRAVAAAIEPRRRRRVQHRLDGAVDHQRAVAVVAASVDQPPRRIEPPRVVGRARLDRVHARPQRELGREAGARGGHRVRGGPVRQLAAQLEAADRPIGPAPHRHPRGRAPLAAHRHAPAQMRSIVRRGVPSGGRT